MSRTLSGRLATGGLVILVGVLLLASTTGVARAATVRDWVPLVIVLLGVWALVRSGFRNLTGPVLVIAIAGTFQLRNLGIHGRRHRHLVAAVRRPARPADRPQPVAPPGARAAGVDADGELTAVGIFGGGDRRLSTDRFAGDELLAVFGGIDLDLRDVSIPAPPAVVEIVCLFGGVEIRD